jgi:hypothetical protein
MVTPIAKDIHSSKKDSPPPLAINCNNQGALTLITTAIINARTKHIDIYYHSSQNLQK